MIQETWFNPIPQKVELYHDGIRPSYRPNRHIPTQLEVCRPMNDKSINSNPSPHSFENHDRLKRLLPDDSAGVLVVSKTLFLNLNFRLLYSDFATSYQVVTPILLTRPGGPRKMSKVQPGIEPGNLSTSKSA